MRDNEHKVHWSMGRRIKLKQNRFETVQMGVVLAASGVAAVIAITRLVGADWSWAATAGVLFGGAAALGQSLGPVRVRRDEHAVAERRVRDVLHVSPAPISEVNPYSMGVFTSDAARTYQGTLAGRPPYVMRTVDDVLRPAIGRLASSGGLVVVRGDPKSGKSRTLWEALVDQVGSRDIYGLTSPIAGAEHTLRPVTTFVEQGVALDGTRSIIWIDDAHDHFCHGLTDQVLVHDLLERYPGVIVAMTVHTHRLRVVERAAGAAAIAEDPKLIRRLREASDPYELDVRWDEAELAHARIAYPGLDEAVEDPEDFKRLARWFAGVYYLVHRYKDKGNRFINPHGVAIAKAAIDWRRAGMPAGISDQQLRELGSIELAGFEPASTFTDDSFQAALDWATGDEDIKAGRYRWKGVALLRPIPDTDPRLWRDFDAVTVLAPKTDGPLSDQCWDFVVRNITPETAMSVGVAAYDANKPTVAELVFRGAAGHGDISAMVNLGLVLHERGDEAVKAEAQQWWQRAANEGVPAAMSNLGSLLDERGDSAGAEQWWRRAADHGLPAAMFCLGSMLRERDDLAGAEQWWRRAADQGAHDVGAMRAMSCLGRLLADRGDEVEAEQWWRRAADQGDADAMHNLAVLLNKRGDASEADLRWRGAADKGDAVNMFVLGVRLNERGDVAGAERWWRRAADQGHAEAMHNLGVNHNQRGDVAGAEQWWRRASEHGCADSMHTLGVTLWGRGDVSGAERWWQKAADRGHAGAMSNLGVMDDQRGDIAGAERWWRRAADLGHPEAMHNLGVILKARTDEASQAEAEKLLRTARSLGIGESSTKLQRSTRRKSGDRRS